MSLTQLLAIWGAVTGTSGALIGLLNFRRDRVRLVVVGTATKTNSAPERPGRFPYDASLLLQATNVGRQPITINHANFALKWREAKWRHRQPVVFRQIAIVGEVPRYADEERARQQHQEESARSRFGLSAEILALGEAETTHLPALLKPGEAFRLVNLVEEHEARSWEAIATDIRPYVEDTQGRVSLGPPLSVKGLMNFWGRGS